MASDKQDEFVQDLVQIQPRLRIFIRAMVRDANQVDDILQETNLVLWRKAGEFTPGTNFGAWACRTAYFQVLSHRKRRGQSRLLFDEQLLHHLADVVEHQTDDLDQRRLALRTCLTRLTDTQRELLDRRYNRAQSIAEIASQVDRPEGSTRQALYRIRLALLNCIRRRLESGEEK